MEQAVPHDAASAAIAVVPYSPGNWHLASTGELDRTILWVSHIVITHTLSAPQSVPQLRLGRLAPNGRTVDAAFQLASEVAVAATTNPDGFAALAHRYSDDITTKDSGGALGGVSALRLPPKYLNALSVLQPGQVSRIIQTPLGFHIIRRELVPSDTTVAGEHIVVGYSGAVTGDGVPQQARTREEALALVRTIQADVRSDSSAFARLANDFGAWSLRNPGPFSRQVARLGLLSMGEISEPIESDYGFELVKRTEVGDRPAYAALYIRLPYVASAPQDAPASRTKQLEVARALARRVAETPAQFDELRRKRCCVDPVRWTRGRRATALTDAVASLAVGEIALEPVEAEGAFFIPRRLDAATVPEEDPPRFELPEPSRPNIDYLLESSNGRGLAQYTRTMSEDAVGVLHLTPANAEDLRRILGDLALAFERGPHPAQGPDRVAAWHAALARIESALGPTVMAQFRTFLDTSVTTRLLTRPDE